MLSVFSLVHKDSGVKSIVSRLFLVIVRIPRLEHEESGERSRFTKLLKDTESCSSLFNPCRGPKSIESSEHPVSLRTLRFVQLKRG